MSAVQEKPHIKIDLWDYVNDTPPPFGHAMLEFFSFDPGFINLNNGTQNLTTLHYLGTETA